MYVVNGGRTIIRCLSIGIVFGFTFSYTFFRITERYEIWGHCSGAKRYKPITHQADHQETRIIRDVNLSNYNDQHISIDRTLKRRIRILCFVITQPQNHEVKTVHIKATWGRRFDNILFMSTIEDRELPTIVLPTVESRRYLWGKTLESFKYIYSHYNDTYDWVMKADDDTYVIEENLRSFLSNYDPNEPFYFGCKFKQRKNQGYMHGGAGYVLSKEAVRKFVVDGLGKRKCYVGHRGNEDLNLGICLMRLTIPAGDSRDTLGRSRFLAFHPEQHLGFGSRSWYYKCVYYPEKRGLNCCSNSAITFHYVPPYQMYVFDYLLYRLHPHSISRDTRLYVRSLNDGLV